MCIFERFRFGTYRLLVESIEAALVRELVDNVGFLSPMAISIKTVLLAARQTGSRAGSAGSPMDLFRPGRTSTESAIWWSPPRWSDSVQVSDFRPQKSQREIPRVNDVLTELKSRVFFKLPLFPIRALTFWYLSLIFREKKTVVRPIQVWVTGDYCHWN